jgi:hypothetical protein
VCATIVPEIGVKAEGHGREQTSAQKWRETRRVPDGNTERDGCRTFSGLCDL